MKKVLTFVAICLSMVTTANAQYSPEKGDFAVEVGFTPFEAGGETFKLNDGMLKARWFFSDKNALRLKIGLGVDNSTTTETDSYNPVNTESETTFDKTTETKDKHTDFSFMLGYERHLFTKGRFDVYAGLELGYGMSKYSGTETYDETSKSYDKNNNLTLSRTIERNTDYTNSSATLNGAGKPLYTSNNYFRGNLFAGVDCYVWKNLYLGAELGLAFKTGKSPNYYTSGYYNQTDVSNPSGGVTSTTITKTTFDDDNGTTTIYQTIDGKVTTGMDGTPKYRPKSSNETTNTSFKLYVEPAIRLGWKF